MKKTHNKKILEVMYHAGFHFSVTSDSITVADPDKPGDKIEFKFDVTGDLIAINTHND